MRASSPYLVTFENKDDYYASLSNETYEQYKSQLDFLISNELPPIVSIRCLAVLFGLSPKFIGSLINKTTKYYRVFNIKKGKKKRRIEAPKVGLKIIQKWIAEHLSKTIQFDECVCGFISKRSHLTAASKHLNAKWVYSIDIENFFQTTGFDKVKKAFLDLNYPEKGAEIAAKLCCYDNFLAQGSPASPVLSNLIFKSLDAEIKKHCQKINIIYTRYADDLVFSSSSEYNQSVQEVKKFIESYGWTLSVKKETLSKYPNRLKVHGLLVHGSKIRLTKGYRNKIRAYKYLMDRNKITSKKDIIRINGHLSLSNSIEIFN